MPNESNQHPIETLRSFGEKAQDMFQKARKKLEPKERKHTKKVQLPVRGKSEEINMNISIKSALKVILLYLLIVEGKELIFFLDDKILIVILAVFVATIIDPGVSKLEEWKVPRGIGILIHYFVALFLITFVVSSFIPVIANELIIAARDVSRSVEQFIENPELGTFLPDAIDQQIVIALQNLYNSISIEQIATSIQQLGQNLLSAAQGSVSVITQIAGSLVAFAVKLVIVLVFAFFIQLEKESIISWMTGFIPRQYGEYAHNKVTLIHTKMAQWVQGQFMLCFSIFLLTFICLSILGVPYALTLSVLAGFCEFIPMVGPVIAAIPAIFIASTKMGIIWAIVIAGVYYLIQQLENNLLVPVVMRRAVGLSPVATMFALLVGVSFPDTIHPVLGVMLAIPATTIIAIFLEDWKDRN